MEVLSKIDWSLILQILGGVVAGLWGVVTSIALFAEKMGKWPWLRKLADWLKKLHDVLSPFAMGNQKKLSIGVHSPILLDETNPYGVSKE